MGFLLRHGCGTERGGEHLRAVLKEARLRGVECGGAEGGVETLF